MNVDIPFNRIFVTGSEQRYTGEAIGRNFIGGDGPIAARCEELLATLHSGARVLLTSSCTHALEMMALLLDIGPGDEVILPSFTFTSTANAFALRGAKLVFADIRADTLNIDEREVERLISPRTKAVVVVHYAGVACEMEAIARAAASVGATLLEDNAHGFMGSWRDRPLGTFGAMSALSFHESKNFTCGEGGALVVNETAFAERAEVIREKGTDRSRFFRGLIDKYTWVDIGSSYVLSDLLAGFLLGQLESRENIQSARIATWERYSNGLRGWAAQWNVRLPFVPADARHPAHLFYLIMPTEGARDSFIAHMRARGIGTSFHYLPLHRSKMAVENGWDGAACPVTDEASSRLVRLPVYAGLQPHELERVVEASAAFRP